MAAFLDLCRFVASAGGTTDWTYSSAVSPYISPTAAGAVNGRVYKVRAESADLTQWEVSEGAYNSSGAGSFGRTTVLYNSAGTGTLQSGAGTKINFTVAPQVWVVASKRDLLSIEEANSFTATQQNQAQKNLGIPAVMRNYVSGLTLSTAGSSATFSVAAGVTADSTNADMLALAASISKTTSAWAVGSGNGGLDTGTIAANTWYHAHLIKRLDTQVVDVLVSLSATAPTLPASYTLFRRVGSMKTNGSSQWTKFSQLGRTFLWDTAVLDVNNVAFGVTTALSTTLSVPTGVQVQAIFNHTAIYTGTTGQMWVSALDTADVTPTPNSMFVTFVNATTASPFVPFTLRTNTSAQIRERSNNAATTRYIHTFGWIDDLGAF